LGYNNPIFYVIKEAGNEYGTSKKLDCIVSLGAGEQETLEFAKPNAFEKTLPLKLIRVLKTIATNTSRVAEETETHFKELPDVYFRLNVRRGMGNMSLDEWSKMGNVGVLTRGYLREENVSKSVDRLVDVLLAGQPSSRNLTLGNISTNLQ
jgi:hypothetical protein